MFTSSLFFSASPVYQKFCVFATPFSIFFFFAFLQFLDMPKQGKAGASQGLPLQKLLFVLQFFQPLRLYAHIIKHPHPRKLSIHSFCQRQQAVFSVQRSSSANTRTRGRGL